MPRVSDASRFGDARHRVETGGIAIRKTRGIASKQVVSRFGDARHRVETGDIAILKREVSRRDDVQYSFIG